MSDLGWYLWRIEQLYGEMEYRSWLPREEREPEEVEYESWARAFDAPLPQPEST